GGEGRDRGPVRVLPGRGRHGPGRPGRPGGGLAGRGLHRGGRRRGGPGHLRLGRRAGGGREPGVVAGRGRAAGDPLGRGPARLAGEFGNGPRWDLAVGVPDEDLGMPGTADAGSVTVLYGFVHGGLTTTSTQRFTQNTAGVAGDAQGGAQFGASLT